MDLRRQLSRWYRRPPDDQPAEVLRWVRRIALGVAAIGALHALLLWAVGSSPWPLAAAAGLLLISAATFGPAIHAAERQGPLPVAQREERRRRALWIMSVFYLLGGPALGYLIGGAGFAFFMFGAMIVVVALMIVWERRRLS